MDHVYYTANKPVEIYLAIKNVVHPNIGIVQHGEQSTRQDILRPI